LNAVGGKRSDYEILPLKEWKLVPKSDQSEIRTGRKKEPVGNEDPNLIHSSFNPIHKEPTTTARGAATTAKEVVVASPSVGSFKQESEIETETLEVLETEFGLNAKQAGKVRADVKRHGLAYVQQKAEITRSEPRKNAAAFFLRALEEDWKPPVKIARKAKNACKEPPKEEPVTPAVDYALEAKLWQEASLEQRGLWMADPAMAFFRKPKNIDNPGNLFLGTLRAILQQNKKQTTEEAAA
jgi:hypothetical protein